MIDTDKYEGCSKTAWRCVGQPYTELVDVMAEINRNGPDSCTSADLELWADAPLLFEEVKRLRKALDWVRKEETRWEKAAYIWQGVDEILAGDPRWEGDD